MNFDQCVRTKLKFTPDINAVKNIFSHLAKFEKYTMWRGGGNRASNAVHKEWARKGARTIWRMSRRLSNYTARAVKANTIQPSFVINDQSSWWLTNRNGVFLDARRRNSWKGGSLKSLTCNNCPTHFHVEEAKLGWAQGGGKFEQ